MEIVKREVWGGPAEAPGHPTAGAKLLVIGHQSHRPHVECGVSLRRERESVLGMHRYHLQKGWGGGGYNWFIFQSGNIYEMRGWSRTGAHTVGRNSSSYGICFVIDGEAYPLTELARQAFIELVGLGMDLGHISPLHERAPHDRFQNKICPGKYIKNTPGIFVGAIPTVTREAAIKPLPTLRFEDGGKTDFPDIFEAVRELQRRLNMPARYRTGYFGPLTRMAVMKFQRKHGLLDDGIVGPKTWGVLATL